MHISVKANQLRMWTLDLNEFRNLVETSLLKDRSIINIHEDPISFSGAMRRIVEKMPYLAVLKNSSKKFPDPDPKTDDFQHLISSFLSKGTVKIRI